MGRFDDLVESPGGVGAFDDIGQQSNGRFNDLVTRQNTRGGATFFTGGNFSKLGDILSTPLYAAAGLTQRGLQKAGVLGGNTPVLDAIKTRTTYSDVLRSVAEQNKTIGSVLYPKKSAGEKAADFATNPITMMNPVAGLIQEIPGTAVGLAADIFLDPLSILGKFGVVSRATKKVGDVVDSAVSSAREIPAVNQIIDKLGRGFVNRYQQSKEFVEADMARKIAEGNIATDVGNITSPIIEKPAFIQKRIAQIIKGGITTNDELREVAQPIRAELDRIGETISSINPKLLSEETFLTNKGTYFPRLFTKYEFPDEAQRVESVFGGRTISTPSGRFKQRVLSESQALERGVITEAGLPATKGLLQLRVAEERQKFYQTVSRIASREPKPGWIQLSDDKALGNLAGKFLPAAEYEAISRIRRVPSVIEQQYLKALSVWKTFKTAYNPATIARNDITNFLVLNPLGGVGPHRLDLYASAARELYTKGPMFQLARKYGLQISTQDAAELSSKARKYYSENRGKLGQFFSKFQDFHDTVRSFYGSQDKFFKMANFIKGVREDGLTAAEAMRRANFYLIDYSEVPTAIEWLRKSPFGVPFISFTYGVSKPLAKTLLERPDKLSLYYKIIQDVQKMNPMGETPEELRREQDVLPDWISSGTYLRLPVKDQHGRSQYVNLQYILPFNVLETNSLTPSSPALMVIASLLFNKDSFTGKELYKESDTSYERAQKIAAWVYKQIVPATFPGGTSANKIVDLINGNPDAHGFVRDAGQVLLDVLGGIKITPIDESVEASKRAYEKQKQISELRSELKKIMIDKTISEENKKYLSGKIIEKIQNTTNAKN